MPKGPHHFPPKGTCIYCRKSDVQLTNEHIVPYSLGGTHVLKKASCLQCADITKKFEQRVARDLWGTARHAFDLPTRRKKERKSQTHLKMPDPEKNSKFLTIPANEYPAAMVFYRMGRAGILSGVPEILDISSMWKLIVIDDDERRKNFINNYSEKLTLTFRHVPDAFGKLLAKIGYCQVFSLLDLSDFNPICLPYIMGEKRNLSYIVGGSLDEIPPEPNNGYSIGVRAFGDIQRIMLIAVIRLFANAHTPVYHVVVGDVAGAENIAKVIEKLKPLDISVSPTYGSTSTLEHWQPSVHPLPFWSAVS